MVVNENKCLGTAIDEKLCHSNKCHLQRRTAAIEFHAEAATLRRQPHTLDLLYCCFGESIQTFHFIASYLSFPEVNKNKFSKIVNMSGEIASQHVL